MPCESGPPGCSYSHGEAYSYIPAFMVGVKMPQSRLFPVYYERQCSHSETKQKFCAECGKLMWKKKHDKTFVSTNRVGRAYVGVLRVFHVNGSGSFSYIEKGKKVVVGMEPVVNKSIDVESLARNKEMIKKNLENFGLWDESNYGIWPIQVRRDRFNKE